MWLTQKDQLLNRGLEIWKPIVAAVNAILGGESAAKVVAELLSRPLRAELESDAKDLQA